MKDPTKEFVLLRILDPSEPLHVAKILRKSEVLKLPNIRATGRKAAKLDEYVQGTEADIQRYLREREFADRAIKEV